MSTRRVGAHKFTVRVRNPETDRFDIVHQVVDANVIIDKTTCGKPHTPQDDLDRLSKRIAEDQEEKG